MGNHKSDISQLLDSLNDLIVSDSSNGWVTFNNKQPTANQVTYEIIEKLQSAGRAGSKIEKR